jgi:predicted butyrate kinase (DUF1464 family)
MGTADKTCVAAFAVWDQAEKYRINYDQTNLICLEMGFGYNAAMVVENGRIVDGIGGTIFPGPGYLTLSLMDGELAYLLGEFTKLKLFEGGVSHIATSGNGAKIIEPDEFAKGLISKEERYVMAWSSMMEGIVKAVSMGMSVLSKQPREVILTGRLSRVKPIFDGLKEELNRKLKVQVRSPRRFTTKAKDVAQGAAIIANGIQGGKYAPLVDTMQIRGAKGTVLDHIYLPNWKVSDVIKNLKNK